MGIRLSPTEANFPGLPASHCAFLVVFAMVLQEEGRMKKHLSKMHLIGGVFPGALISSDCLISHYKYLLVKIFNQF